MRSLLVSHCLNVIHRVFVHVSASLTSSPWYSGGSIRWGSVLFIILLQRGRAGLQDRVRTLRSQPSCFEQRLGLQDTLREQEGLLLPGHVLSYFDLNLKKQC